MPIFGATCLLCLCQRKISLQCFPDYFSTVNLPWRIPKKRFIFSPQNQFSSTSIAVHRVPDVPRRELHLLRAGRQDLLQEGLRQALRGQVWKVRPAVRKERLCDEGQEQDLSPGVLLLLRLRTAAHTRGQLRSQVAPKELIVSVVRRMSLRGKKNRGKSIVICQWCRVVCLIQLNCLLSSFSSSAFCQSKLYWSFGYHKRSLEPLPFLLVGMF